MTYLFNANNSYIHRNVRPIGILITSVESSLYRPHALPRALPTQRSRLLPLLRHITSRANAAHTRAAAAARRPSGDYQLALRLSARKCRSFASEEQQRASNQKSIIAIADEDIQVKSPPHIVTRNSA